MFKCGLVLLSALLGVKATALEDEIVGLPGIQFQTEFRQFSGYLDAGDNNFFHYWFVESQQSPSKDPVVLWLNGGPGCSSLVGLLTENGPYRLDLDGEKVWENIFSWNKSPGSVGYSYSLDGSTAGPPSDNQTAELNYNALMEFFGKFGEYNHSDFYIAGESYAGVYIPTLAAYLIDNAEFPANFKGVAIGNGFYGQRYIQNSYLEFIYNHGILGDELWFPLLYECCNDTAMCDFTPFFNNMTDSQACVNMTYVAADKTRGLDPYNLYYACYDRLFNWTQNNVVAKLQSAPQFASPYSDPKIRRSHLMGIQRDALLGEDKYLDCHPPGANNTEKYMNRADVRKALHIPSDSTLNLPAWNSCNMKINKEWVSNYDNMVKTIHALLDAKIRVLMYSGDVDSVVNVVAGERFADYFTLKEMQSRRPWLYEHEHPSIAGFSIRYAGLDFLSVRGAGHFVPSDKPAEALQMFGNFLAGTDYSNPINVPFTPAPPVTPTKATTTTTTAGNMTMEPFETTEVANTTVKTSPAHPTKKSASLLTIHVFLLLLSPLLTFLC